MKTTELESRLLNAIATDEMTPLNGAVPTRAYDVCTYVCAPRWANELGVSEQAIGGCLSSLEKKGLVVIGFDEGETLVDFTDSGFAAWQRAQAGQNAQIVNDLNALGYDACETTEAFRIGYTNGSMDKGRGTVAVYDDGMGGWYAYDTIDAALLVMRLLDHDDEASRYDAYSEWCSVCDGVSCDEDDLD